MVHTLSFSVSTYEQASLSSSYYSLFVCVLAKSDVNRFFVVDEQWCSPALKAQIELNEKKKSKNHLSSTSSNVFFNHIFSFSVNHEMVCCVDYNPSNSKVIELKMMKYVIQMSYFLSHTFWCYIRIFWVFCLLLYIFVVS